MKLRINYSDGTEKTMNISKVDILPVPDEKISPPMVFHINNTSDTELFILASSNIISDITKIKNIDFIE